MKNLKSKIMSKAAPWIFKRIYKYLAPRLVLSFLMEYHLEYLRVRGFNL